MSVEPPPKWTLLDDGDGQLGAMVRTVLFAENRTSREPLCFPMTTASVLIIRSVRTDW